MAQHNKITRSKSYKRNASTIKRIGACICVLLVFLGGFLLRGNTELLTSLGFKTTASESEVNPGQTVSGNTFESVSARVAEMEGVLKTSSLDSFDLDDATKSVLNSFAASTEDPYLRYFDADEYATYLRRSSNSFSGIGALFGEYNGMCYAVDVFEGSSAANHGVQTGDFIVAIDGDRKQKWSLPEVVNTLDRKEGEYAVITWRRPTSLDAEGGDEFSTTLTYGKTTENNVTTELDDTVGVIKVNQITSTVSDSVKKAVTDLQGRGALSYVLDLRDNPGGYLTQAVDISSLFIKSGTVVRIDTKEGSSTKSVSGETVTDAPLVVIINGNTGASAEVLAAALKDTNRASIVGAKSLGKGTVQVVRELSFGGALRYTAATYISPQGYSIDGNGVTPDVSVTNYSDGNDYQKTVAIETAQSKLITVS